MTVSTERPFEGGPMEPIVLLNCKKYNQCPRKCVTYQLAEGVVLQPTTDLRLKISTDHISSGLIIRFHHR